MPGLWQSAHSKCVSPGAVTGRRAGEQAWVLWRNHAGSWASRSTRGWRPNMTSPRPGVGTGRKVPCGEVRVKQGKNLVFFFFSFFLCSYLEGESQVQAFSLVNLAFGGSTHNTCGVLCPGAPCRIWTALKTSWEAAFTDPPSCFCVHLAIIRRMASPQQSFACCCLSSRQCNQCSPNQT